MLRVRLSGSPSELRLPAQLPLGRAASRVQEGRWKAGKQLQWAQAWICSAEVVSVTYVCSRDQATHLHISFQIHGRRQMALGDGDLVWKSSKSSRTTAISPCPPAIPGLDAPVKKWSWVQSIARNIHGPTEVNLWSGFQWGYFCPLNCDTGFTWKEVPTLGWSRGRAGTWALGPVYVPCGSRKRDMYGFSKLWDQIHWFYLSRLRSEAKSISK